MNNADRLDALEANLNTMKDRQEEMHGSMKALAETTQIGMEDVQKRLAKMDLNGHAEQLRALANATPDLLQQKDDLKEIMPSLKKLAGVDIQKTIFNRELARKLRLNNRIVRGASVAIFGAICYALIVDGSFGSGLTTLLHNLP